MQKSKAKRRRVILARDKARLVLHQRAVIVIRILKSVTEHLKQEAQRAHRSPGEHFL